MPIRFYCEKCHFRLRTPDGSAGMIVNCSRCAHKQAVPPVTDPEAEKASQNRRAFLVEVGKSQVFPVAAEDQAAYEEPTLEMVLDDQEDVFVAEIADDDHHDDHAQHDPDTDDTALSELGRALVPQQSQPIPDFHAAFTKPKPLPPQDGADALAGLAQQVQSAPSKPASSGPRSGVKPPAKPAPKPTPPARKPAPAPPKVLRPAPRHISAHASHKRVPALIVWACRFAGAAGIPCAVKIGLITRDATGDGLAGLLAGCTIGILVIIAFALGEIAESL
jgi:hypothetical protein